MQLLDLKCYILKDRRIAMRSFTLFLCHQVLNIWIHVRSSNAEVAFRSFNVELISRFYKYTCFRKDLSFPRPWSLSRAKLSAGKHIL
jgi:hypothetical protein